MEEKTDLDCFQKILENANVRYERRAYEPYEGVSMNDIGYALTIHPDGYKVIAEIPFNRSAVFFFTFNKKLEYVELS